MNKFLDPTKWSSAAAFKGYPSVPVQLEVDSKDQSGKLNTDITAITQFRPFIDLEEEEYFVNI